MLAIFSCWRGFVYSCMLSVGNEFVFLTMSLNSLMGSQLKCSVTARSIAPSLTKLSIIHKVTSLSKDIFCCSNYQICEPHEAV